MVPNITKILLIGHQVEHLRVLKDCLFDGGHYNVLCAFDNLQTIEISEKEQPEVIILDWEPIEKKNLKILKNLRKRSATNHIPIIIISESFVDINKLKDKIDFTAINYVRKPFDDYELLTRVNSILECSHILKDTIAQKLKFEDQLANLLLSDGKERKLNLEIERLDAENKDLNNKLQLEALHAANCNDFMQKLSKNLADIIISIPAENADCRKKILQAMGQLEQYLSKNFWPEFKLRFSDLHTDFYDRLIREYPKLSETDLRLCALIKLKMSTKEIAEVINQSANSVKVARNRLRRKLNIEDPAETLLHYFAGY